MCAKCMRTTVSFVIVLLFKIWFCVFMFLFFYVFSFFLSGVSFIVTVVIFVAYTFVTCFNKDQSINQSLLFHITLLCRFHTDDGWNLR